jgi:hypothetical protein
VLCSTAERHELVAQARIIRNVVAYAGLPADFNMVVTALGRA